MRKLMELWYENQRVVLIERHCVGWVCTARGLSRVIISRVFLAKSLVDPPVVVPGVLNS
jgi:hypothetical protein